MKNKGSIDLLILGLLAVLIVVLALPILLELGSKSSNNTSKGNHAVEEASTHNQSAASKSE